jgi:uncharacterized Zn-binding protein involved in type VI secretion
MSATIKREFPMSIRKAAMAALVAGSMVAVPAVAQAQTANQTAVSKLSVASAPVARQGAKVAKKNDLRGGSVIIALLAAAAVIAGIVIAADGSNNPSSP